MGTREQERGPFYPCFKCCLKTHLTLRMLFTHLSQVLGSKIHKTLKTLASLDRQSLPQHEYTDDDVNHIREKSRELHAKFRKMSENESIRKETDNNRKLSAVSEGKSESQQR